MRRILLSLILGGTYIYNLKLTKFCVRENLELRYIVIFLALSLINNIIFRKSISKFSLLTKDGSPKFSMSKGDSINLILFLVASSLTLSTNGLNASSFCAYISDYLIIIFRNILIFANMVVGFLIIGFVLLQRGEEGVFNNKSSAIKTDNKLFFKATIIAGISYVLLNIILGVFLIRVR
jgi:preprotein translocase subunit SecG